MITRVSIVLAHYCPHCVPFSLRNAEKMAKNLEVPLRVLDIQVPEQEVVADKLVEKYGDWSEDYLIPQVFVEYADRGVRHILTGFSEAVSATEAAWEALFSSHHYRSLVREQAISNRKSLKEVVERYLSFKGLCRRHCNKPTSLIELWSDSNTVVGAYVCPDGYVSRVIYFSTAPDVAWFKTFLTTQVGEGVLKDRDLRPATRHGWELEGGDSTNISNMRSTSGIKEVYWTRYPRTEEEKRRGIFLCSDTLTGERCRRLFVQDTHSPDRLCPQCR